MTIDELVNKYKNLGNDLKNAQNLAAEEILITAISKSELLEHLTLKGGIVMYNITKNNRRVTKDIDFDLIHYSIDDDSIRKFVFNLNASQKHYSFSIKGIIEELKHEDYRGKRINLLIRDKDGGNLTIKLDIGVNTYDSISQDLIIFDFQNDGNTISINSNSTNQIFSEKLLSLARHGVLSTRYKDIYDMYYLVSHSMLESQKVKEILHLFINNANKKPNNIDELKYLVENTLNNADFLRLTSKSSNKWIDMPIEVIANEIIGFINRL